MLRTRLPGRLVHALPATRCCRTVAVPVAAHVGARLVYSSRRTVAIAVVAGLHTLAAVFGARTLCTVLSGVVPAVIVCVDAARTIV
ncbi:MAG: hypothetical protein WA869_22930 [Alloacidobacterium sp.]